MRSSLYPYESLKTVHDPDRAMMWVVPECPLSFTQMIALETVQLWNEQRGARRPMPEREALWQIAWQLDLRADEVYESEHNVHRIKVALDYLVQRELVERVTFDPPKWNDRNFPGYRANTKGTK